MLKTNALIAWCHIILQYRLDPHNHAVPGCLYFVYGCTIAGLARSGVQGATADRKGAEVGTGTPRHAMAEDETYPERV